MSFDDELTEKASLRAELRQRDFDDLQNEVAGNETGRAVRFLPEGARGQDAVAKRKAEQAEMLTRLQLIMRDPAYAALYNNTMDRLAEAESATEIALTKALDLQRVAEEALAEVQNRALKLADGRRVYRDEDGAFCTENGLAVSDSEMGSIAERWNPGIPGFANTSRGAMPAVRLFHAMFYDAWNLRLTGVASAARILRDDLKKTDKQIEGLLDRVVESDNRRVAAAYEKRIAKLEEDRILLGERLASGGAIEADLGGVVRTRSQVPVKPLEHME